MGWQYQDLILTDLPPSGFDYDFLSVRKLHSSGLLVDVSGLPVGCWYQYLILVCYLYQDMMCQGIPALRFYLNYGLVSRYDLYSNPRQQN